MKLLPLYPEPPLAAVERAHPMDVDPGCRRCPLHLNAQHHVCIGAEGEPGGVLLVGEGPGRNEDAMGRPFVGESGRLLRQVVQRNWSGPVAFDNATRCYPGREKEKVLERAVGACRGYLAQTVREVGPTRVVALGGWAMLSILGRKLPPLSVRRGYGWLYNAGQPVPVFLAIHPAAAMRNRFVRQWFEEDLKWALTAQVPFRPAWDGVAKVVTQLSDAEEAELDLSFADWFTYDWETVGVMYRPFQGFMVSFTPKGQDYAWVFDVDSMKVPGVRDVLRRLMTSPKLRRAGQNLKFDEQATALELGVVPPDPPHLDCRLVNRLLNTEADSDLETMAELVGMGGHKEAQQEAMAKAAVQVKKIAKRNAAPSKQMMLVEALPPGLPAHIAADIRDSDSAKAFAHALVPRDIERRYNALDSISTARLAEHLEQRLAEDHPGISYAWNRIVRPASQAVRQVEQWGMAVSVDAMRAFHTYLDGQKQEVLSRLRAYGDFNPGAPADVAKLLFDRLGLEPLKRGKSGAPSTDKETLNALKDAHPVVADLLAYRKLDKMDGTYAVGLLDHVRDDGRIHPSITLDVAATGRTSCREPNLQNIPRATDTSEGKMAKDVFIAPPGYTLLQADYSQLELRIAAALSGDPEMRKIFEEGVDFHQRTAEFIAPIVWGIKPEDVKKPHRSAAKAFNFGILYGMSDPGIAHRAGCTLEVAMQIRAAVLGKFKRLAVWVQERLRYSRQTGVTFTWWEGMEARRRNLYKIAEMGSDDEASLARSNAENSSYNTPVQGTGSDFCLMSLTEVVNWILGEGFPAKLVIPVHDSLVLEVREDCLEEAAFHVNRIMCQWPANHVPIKVDLETGNSWGSLEKYQLAA